MPKSDAYAHNITLYYNIYMVDLSTNQQLINILFTFSKYLCENMVAVIAEKPFTKKKKYGIITSVIFEKLQTILICVLINL